MNPVFIVFLTILIISSVIILFQDFKDREVSLWVLILFGLLCVSSVVYYRNLETILYNGLGVLVYGGFIWLILKLYLFLKFKKNKPILNHQLGLADVFVVLFIGITFNTAGVVFFFCFGFVFSLITFVVYSLLKRDSDTQSIPLAGLLVFFYVMSIIILNLVSLNQFIDCSFVL
jgi:hypothetical protein